MNWFRTIPRFVCLLVALLSLAQFAGVVSSPRANARPIPGAAPSHDHQGAQGMDAQGMDAQGMDAPAMAHHHGGREHGTGRHDDHGASLADTCCALHAYFAGVLPEVVAIDTAPLVGTRLAANLDDGEISVSPGRLDRPPRPMR